MAFVIGHRLNDVIRYYCEYKYTDTKGVLGGQFTWDRQKVTLEKYRRNTHTHQTEWLLLLLLNMKSLSIQSMIPPTSSM